MLPAGPPNHRGQALVEFAIVFPVLFLLVAGIIQFGLIFWAQNTLTQIARDTGRWAATQQDCGSGAVSAAITTTANNIAAQSSLLGFDGSLESVTPIWVGSPCPPNNNQQEAWVRVTITNTVPVFFPLVPNPFTITTATEFRMEPRPK